MAEKKYVLTESQLKGVIENAVTSAISQLDSLAIVDNIRNDGNGEFTPEEYDEAMRVMAANRGKGSEPLGRG